MTFDGPGDFVITATDDAGNTSAPHTTQVIDTGGPTITGPTDISVYEFPTTGAVYTITDNLSVNSGDVAVQSATTATYS